MSDSSSISPPPSPGYRCLALYQASVALQRRKDELHNQVEARRTSMCQVKKLPKEDLDATFDRLHTTGARPVTPKRRSRHDDDDDEKAPPPPPPKEIKENPRCLALYESGRDALERKKKLQEAEEEKRAGGKAPKLSPTKLKESCERLYKSGSKPQDKDKDNKENEEALRSASPATRRVEELYQRGKSLLSQRRSSFQEKFGAGAQPSKPLPPPLPPNSRLEQLYQTAFHKRDNIERKKFEMEEDEMRICTFSPAINTIRYAPEERPHTPGKVKQNESDALGEMLTTEEGGWVAEPEPRSHKLYRNALETRERLMHEQERRRRQDLRECTFTPKINRVGREGDVFSSLYTDAIAHRERRARELDERWGEGASSTPMLQSPYRASPARRESPSQIDRTPGPSRARSPVRTPAPTSPVPEAAPAPAPAPTPAPAPVPHSPQVTPVEPAAVPAPAQTSNPVPVTSAVSVSVPLPTAVQVIPSVPTVSNVDASPLYVRPEIRLLGSAAAWPHSPRISDLPDLHAVATTTSHLPPARRTEADLSPLPPPRPEVDVYTTITTTTITHARPALRQPPATGSDRYVDLAAVTPVFGVRH